MYRTIEDLKEAMRRGESFCSIFNETLGLNELTEESFQLLGQLNEEENYIDFTTKNWCQLSISSQIKYASLYQKWYAKSVDTEIERRFKIKRRFEVKKKKSWFANFFKNFEERKEAKIQDEKSFSDEEFFIEMIFIPPGRYWQGVLTDKEGRGVSTEKRRKVLISKPFWCGKYPVTQKQWKGVMGTNPSKFKRNDRPIENVSWDDCRRFCWMIEMNFLSEAQWEFACRGGTTSFYSFGENSFELKDYAWYDSDKTFDVGQKFPNSFGLYDMHGNVWEWCRDTYQIDYGGNGTEIANEEAFNSSRVYRGGSWYSNAESCHSAIRLGYLSTREVNFLGFRVSKPFQRK